MKHNHSQTMRDQNDLSPGSARRVLVVEDDAPMREVLYEMLQEWSFTTCMAANFREAREAVIREAPFTVIVSDYHLPDGNGLEFLDWLKREIQVVVPFLLMSGGVTRSPTAADGYEFLAKPFHLQELHNRLEALCRMPAPLVAPVEWSFVPAESSVAQEAMASVYARAKPPRNGEGR